MKNLENLLLTTSSNETQSSNSVREYSEIPDDVLVDILSRLPRKSIARFRCVSKLWASILRRPDFTELFLTKSYTRPRLLFTVEADGKLFFYSSPQPQNPNDNSFLVAIPYHASLPKYVPSLYCKTVCGLVLLQGCRRKLRVICNPATGEFLTLHNPADRKSKEKIAKMYLGYDPMGKQFKVLCMTSSCVERPNSHQVLTLESGKRLWRKIEHKFHFVDNGRMVGDICINGVLYFGAKFKGSCVIVCFDVRSEKFRFINTDKDMSPKNVGSLTLFNYRGKLCTRHWYSELLVVLWVLEDAGNHKWSKHTYVLTPLGNDRYYTFVGMTCTGEIVLLGLSNPIYVFFYNLETNTFTRVSIQGTEDFNNPRIRETLLDYVENLRVM